MVEVVVIVLQDHVRFDGASYAVTRSRSRGCGGGYRRYGSLVCELCLNGS
jgi:hypothetical protein